MIRAPDERGVGSRWVRIRHARRLALIEATAEVFAEHGYESADMGMLASAADVTKATLYAHFRGKSRLFEAVLGHWMDSLPTPTLSSVGGAELHNQLAAVERHLRHPALAAMTRALARSVYVPESYLERWQQRHRLLLRFLEDVLSKSAECDNAGRAACQFLNLALCNIERRDAMKFGNSLADCDVASVFARAYGTHECACDRAARQE